jgi:hypothetical protein
MKGVLSDGQNYAAYNLLRAVWISIVVDSHSLMKLHLVHPAMGCISLQTAGTELRFYRSPLVVELDLV